MNKALQDRTRKRRPGVLWVEETDLFREDETAAYADRAREGDDEPNVLVVDHAGRLRASASWR